MPATCATNRWSRRRPRWLRFSLRALLAAVTGFGVLLGIWVNRAERQRSAVAAIRDAGGNVFYDFEWESYDVDLPYPWLSRVLGIDYLADPVSVVLDDDATDTDLRHVAMLPKVDTLLVLGSHVTDSGLSHLSELRHLQELSLASTDVTGSGLTHLGRLASLESLHLDSTETTDAALAYLRQLPSLKELSLSNTRIGESGLENLGRLTTLEHLNLEDTSVSDDDLDDLTTLTDLTRLLLHGTNVTAAGTKRIRRALPKCDIWRLNALDGW